MTIEELIILGKKYTNSTHAKMLLATFLNCNSLELLTRLNDQVPKDIIIKYQKALKALKEGTPIQYALGTVNFYGLTYFVNENVLIPRFETEELVENVKKYFENKNKDNIKILDLGCGSGVIGLTLKYFFKNANVTLTDISKEALSVAKANAKNLKLDVEFLESDWFSNIKEEKYDLIISNPPYLRYDEDIEDIVKNNEPHLALYGGGVDGLDTYRQIFKNIKPYLKEDTLLAFEIDYQAKENLKKLVNETFKQSKITFKKDMSQKTRILFVENIIA